MGRLRWVGNGLRGHEYAVPEAWKHGGAIQLSGQATHAIIEEGPYRLSCNPLYVGLLALYLGLALLAPTFWGLVLFPAAVLLVLWGAIYPEEPFLHKRFGAPYDDYTRRVRRWL